MAVAVSGDVALTASFDNTVGEWGLDTLRPRWLDGHAAAVKAVIALPDRRAASAGDDFAVIVWDLESGTVLHRLNGHRGSVADLAVSRDGDVLASAGWDGRIGLWDARSGEHLAWLDGHDGAVNAVAFGAGGTLYSGSADGTLREWDVAARVQRTILARHGFGINAILVDESAGWLVYGAVDGGTRVLSLPGGAVLADLTAGRRPILSLAASASGGLVAVGDGEGYVMVVGTAGWDVRHDMRAAARGPVWAIAFVGEDALLAGGIDDAARILPIDGEGTPMGQAERGFLRPPGTMGNGERQFRRKCSVCHSLTAEGPRRAGPHFAGLFGRPSGSVAGYAYSSVLAGGDIVWSATTLDALFDAGPDHYIPGSKMPMQRITAVEDRRDLIEYLRSNTR